MDEELQHAGVVFTTIRTVSSFGSSLLIISLTLFLIDAYNPVLVGLLWGVHFAVLAFLDYPTGVLGDVIGYKRVYLIAYLIKIVGCIVFIFEQNYNGTLLFMILLGIGLSQESGALSSWFDNSYKIKAKDDDRRIFSNLQARAGILWNVSTVAGFVLGGFITNSFSLSILLICYLLVLFSVFGLTLLLVKEIVLSNNIGFFQRFHEYFNQIKSSMKLFFTSKIIFFYFIGTAFLWAANASLWHPLISIRLYRAYTGSTAGAGLFRSVILFSVVLWQVVVVKFIDKFANAKFWLVLSSFVSNSLFFTLIMLYYLSFPPVRVSLFLIVGFFLIYQPAMFLESIEAVLRRRVELDMIPNEQRNSMYSLLPTISRGFGAIFVIIAGNLLDHLALVGVFMWLIFIAFLGSLIFGFGLSKSEI